VLGRSTLKSLPLDASPAARGPIAALSSVGSE
jgi:hypothetical protein